METKLKHITGTVRQLAEDVKETRTIEFVISTEQKDRHGTIIPIENWALENFNRNGIVGYQHDVYGGWFGSDPDSVIGKGRAWVEGNQLIGSVTFEPAEINPLAEKIFQKVLFGSLTSTSVGFIEKSAGDFRADNQDDPKSPRTYVYGEVELLEFSIVNIPSNSEAIKRELDDKLTKKIEEIVAKAFEPKKEKASAQILARLRLQEIEINNQKLQKNGKS